MDDPDEPGLRFRLTYTAFGQLVGFEVADWRMVATGDALLPDDLPLERDEWLPTPEIITVRRLRQLPFRRIDAAARREMVELIGDADEEMLDGFKAPGRPGRRGRTDDFYVPLVMRYVELLGQGHAVKALGEEIGQAPATVRNWLHEARRRGLLTQGARGREGGEPTDLCRSIYQEMQIRKESDEQR